MARRDFENTDSSHFREWLEKGVILVGGDAEGSIDTDDETPVFVSVVVNVTGYGPHVGVIYAIQNQYHGHPDAALQPAYEILEEWEMDHNPDHFKELEAEYGDEASGVFTETFDAMGWKLSAKDFAAAIAGTDATKYINIHSSQETEEPRRAKETRMTTQEYNGWTNRETWNVALWFGNDYGLYQSVKEHPNRFTAQTAKRFVQELLPDGTPDFRIGRAEYAKVDWQEIADDFNEMRGEKAVKEAPSRGRMHTRRALPTANIYWRDIPMGARVELIGHSYIVTLPGGRRAGAYWNGQESVEAQRNLDQWAKLLRRYGRLQMNQLRQRAFSSVRDRQYPRSPIRALPPRRR
jgi:hypothetical protein